MQTLPGIQLQLSNKDLFEAFKRQLMKDFEQSSFRVAFIATLEPEYERIHKTIALELARNEIKTNANLMQLLYRIDISEAQLKRYRDKDKNEKYFNVVAELIIKRILQKVVVRQLYKNKEDS